MSLCAVVFDSVRYQVRGFNCCVRLNLLLRFLSFMAAGLGVVHVLLSYSPRLGRNGSGGGGVVVRGRLSGGHGRSG